MKWIKVAVWLLLLPWISQFLIVILEVGFGILAPEFISLNQALLFGICAIFLSYMHSSGPGGFAMNEKYEKSRIDKTQLNENLAVIQEAITANRLYEDPNFSLNALADTVHFTARRTSLTINQATGQNFVDFINTYRVEAFKNKILEGESKHFTIVAIAEKCGFKSSSTFYTAFKKHTGMTPRQYVDSLA